MYGSNSIFLSLWHNFIIHVDFCLYKSFNFVIFQDYIESSLKFLDDFFE